jgi:hypothetical protein
VLVLLTNSSTAFFPQTPRGLTDESTAIYLWLAGKSSKKPRWNPESSLKRITVHLWKHITLQLVHSVKVC